MSASHHDGPESQGGWHLFYPVLTFVFFVLMLIYIYHFNFRDIPV